MHICTLAGNLKTAHFVCSVLAVSMKANNIL